MSFDKDFSYSEMKIYLITMMSFNRASFGAIVPFAQECLLFYKLTTTKQLVQLESFVEIWCLDTKVRSPYTGP
jgi:hypothetical protein